MTRTITASFRRSAETSFADEVILCFLTISHSTFSDDIRVVWDTQDYVIDGDTFIGFPFDISILSDDENPPAAQLAIQNVDPRIGDSVRALTSPPRIKIQLMYSADITDLTGSFADVIYSADKLFLINVSVDIMQITGTIVGWDYLQRVWPGPRAMESVFPGLFR